MAANSRNGTTYNLATSREVDGKKVWDNRGTLFIREGSKGGVLYLKQGDTEIQIGVFKKRYVQKAAEPQSAPAQS